MKCSFNTNLLHAFKRLGILVLIALLFWLFLFSCKSNKPQNSIKQVIDSFTYAIKEKGNWQQFQNVKQAELIPLFSGQDLKVLSTAYWQFDVNQDVDVFVCRDTAQNEVPFWLIEEGFIRTNAIVENDLVRYEVWQKRFAKGRIGLGINGFDRHRFTYFVALKPVDSDQFLDFKPIFPEQQNLYSMTKGQYTYRDWDELTLTKIPSLLEGAYVIPTFRGRSREAHLIDGFRETLYPSSEQADQVLLSWVDSPLSSQYISWRTHPSVETADIKYWEISTRDTLFLQAGYENIEDPLLINDLENKRFSADISDLKSGTRYGYRIMVDGRDDFQGEFKTAHPDGGFEFAWFGDIHNDPDWGAKLRVWGTKYPDVKFHLFVGDLVNTGLYRDQWDVLWNAAKPILDRPVFSAPGNHDSQEGLPATLFYNYLKGPKNGTKLGEQTASYSFVYQNTLFVVLDAVGTGVELQKKWLQETLAQSKEQFKIVAFHFAPYTTEGEYLDIQQHWIPLFEQYGVDLVLNGHFHFYQRFKPKEKGPIYVMSIGTSVKNDKIISDSTRGKWVNRGYLYQHVKIDSERLIMTSLDEHLSIIDQFEIIKKN